MCCHKGIQIESALMFVGLRVRQTSKVLKISMESGLVKKGIYQRRKI